jgi:hypothetical protein
MACISELVREMYLLQKRLLVHTIDEGPELFRCFLSRYMFAGITEE